MENHKKIFGFNPNQPHKPWQDKLNGTRNQGITETRIKRPNPVQRPKSPSDFAAGKLNSGILPRHSSDSKLVKGRTAPLIKDSSSSTSVKHNLAPLKRSSSFDDTTTDVSKE